MQQTDSLSGRPVIILAQTAPMNTHSSSRHIAVTSELAQHFTRLGVAHVVIGALCIVFQVVALALSEWSPGHGIWIGSLFVVTGVFGILAGKKSEKCQLVVFNVLSILSAAFAVVLICIAAPFAADIDFYYSYYYRRTAIATTVFEALMAALGLAEGIVALYSTVICCTIGVCCCDCGGSCCCPADPEYQQFHDFSEPETRVAQQQFSANNQRQPMFNANQLQSVCNANQGQPVWNANQQQPVCNANQSQPVWNANQQQPVCNANQGQPVCNANQGQPVYNANQQQPTCNTNQQHSLFIPNPQQMMFNPNQQQLVFNPKPQQIVYNPNQQQLVFNPSQQQLVFNPNQQQLVFNPNQQQTVFNPNQQQMVFNPNQQQLVFLPTQPVTGFHPQQQSVQCYQQNATLNSQQPDFTASLSGPTGQGTCPSKPITTSRPEGATERRGATGADDDQGVTDDDELQLHDGPFGDSENRY